ncbi:MULTISPECIES: LacI family DNA-binding transcriptional regulator [unclassified Polaribacter]|uniref:LacI family DNA-binding transcriptional regulator n=1 Tax=unclassified Polaribacter TaxID=196858 RepID=UPI0011BFD2ED|nr:MULTISPECIES: LacI family DNA-binding transcriptional regulator [unclassified Polaribacter]TXD53534.1 substrate-binding domain-containing protein [Polaribacter sp. IC063]TXD58606.1 substrate-binding domain-containing protein [Polaribacter sp. IC066]
MKKYTIKDIAELAGVSKGTVDRVIHKRGKVSAKAYEKVNAVLNEIDYKPNLLARSLKNTKEYHICVVLPDYKEDAFWTPCFEGIQEAINEYSSFGIFIEYYFFDLMQPSSFLEVHKKVLGLLPNAVLLAPLFYKETVKVVANYNNANILVSKFNNQLDIENSKNFVGQDLFKSGRIAASLMKEITSKNATIAIINIDEDSNNAIYVQEKEKGFRSYFNEIGNYTIVTWNCKQQNIDDTLGDFIDNHSGLAGIFVTTSKVYKIAAFIKNKQLAHIKIIGYDLLDENIKYLNQHIIHFLIHQNPKKQVYLGLTYLVEHFLFNREIPAKSLLPIDIITAENLDTYLEV